MTKPVRIFAVFLCFLLGACAVGDTFSMRAGNLPAIESGKGRVTVYRPKAPLGFFKSLIFTMDGAELSDIPEANIFIHDVNPGSHRMSLKDGVFAPMTVNVNAGQEVFLKVAPMNIDTSGASSGESSYGITQESRAVATKDLPELVLIETKVRTLEFAIAPLISCPEKDEAEDRLTSTEGLLTSLEKLYRQNFLTQDEYTQLRQKIIDSL